MQNYETGTRRTLSCKGDAIAMNTRAFTVVSSDTFIVINTRVYTVALWYLNSNEELGDGDHERAVLVLLLPVRERVLHLQPLAWKPHITRANTRAVNPLAWHRDLGSIPATVIPIPLKTCHRALSNLLKSRK